MKKQVMKTSLLTVSLLLATNLNFAMSPLVKNLSRVSNQIGSKTAQNQAKKSLPFMFLNQKRNLSMGETILFGVYTMFILTDLDNIKKESQRTNDLLEMQNYLLKEQLKIKSVNDTTKQK
jgi:hypothetical protein